MSGSFTENKQTRKQRDYNLQANKWSGVLLGRDLYVDSSGVLHSRDP